MLAGGRTVTADAAYLRESILEPAAKVVATYPAIMPSYRTQLSESELASLVEYLQSGSGLRGAIASGAGRGAAIDPVCGCSPRPAGHAPSRPSGPDRLLLQRPLPGPLRRPSSPGQRGPIGNWELTPAKICQDGTTPRWATVNCGST